jgi:hypothetical protein
MNIESLIICYAYYMTIKHFFKKQKQGTTKKRILWVIIFILVAIQAITTWYLIQLWSSNAAVTRMAGDTYFSRAMESRYSDPIIDISENRVYIPEARIYLPLNETTRKLQYRYLSAFEHQTLYLSISRMVGRVTEGVDPSCNNLVLVSDSNKNKSSNLAGTLAPTADGLQYIYIDKSCEPYTADLRKDIAEAAKTITPY